MRARVQKDNEDFDLMPITDFEEATAKKIQEAYAKGQTIEFEVVGVTLIDKAPERTEQ